MRLAAPRSAAVRREVDQLLGEALAPKPVGNQAEGLPELAGPRDLTATEVAEMRQAAAAELMNGQTAPISMTVDRWGPAAADRIYGTGLVHPPGSWPA